MSSILVQIKRAVLAGNYVFSEKARIEMEIDGLTELDVAESILNAVAIYKRIRSTSPLRRQAREYLYVIQSTNLDGLIIYTKGKLVREQGVETYYPRFFQKSDLRGDETYGTDYALSLLRQRADQKSTARVDGQIPRPPLYGPGTRILRMPGLWGEDL